MAVMYKWAELIRENGAELALMDTIDMGKPIYDMVGVDIPMCVETVQYFAECIDKMTGQITATEYDVMSTVLREPIGVVGCISPWNYPLLMALWKVSWECGGKGPQIFCEDLQGELLDRAVESAIDGIFFNMGQVCSAGSRLIVHADIHDTFVEKFIEMGKDAYTCGDPLDPKVNLGPLVDHESQARVLSMVETAKSEGGTVMFGGKAADGDLQKGAYIVPTMITGVSDNDSIAQFEAFGPVVAVIKVDSDDEAIEVANNSIYGLQGSVWTDNYRKAMRYVREVECGTFLVNSFEEGDMTQPFGG